MPGFKELSFLFYQYQKLFTPLFCACFTARLDKTKERSLFKKVLRVCGDLCANVLLGYLPLKSSGLMLCCSMLKGRVKAE